MPFRVTARTVLQLGAELISSDGIAFYELIKNAFDAKSQKVEIEIVVRIPGDKALTLHAELKAANTLSQQDALQQLRGLQNRVSESVDITAPNASELQSDIAKARSLHELTDCLEGANYILIRDTGEGMSLDDLQDVYLTIGTRARLKERLKSPQKSQSGNGARPILGEKGLGRLSTMRLGNRLKVLTSRAGDRHWNELTIDWTRFSHESDELIGEIPVEPRLGMEKDSTALSGTTLLISGLAESWSKDKLAQIAREEFSKLTDPFRPNTAFPVTVWFNKEIVPIPRFNELLFEHAHATVSAEFAQDSQSGEFILKGTVNYRLLKRKQEFSVRQIDILSIAKIESPDVLKSMGPFSVRAYWFNRRILEEIEGIGDLKQVRKVVAQWGGGLMLYRDGFRVNPYGSSDDDWLELDPKALASGAYKVNRQQIIGKVEISSSNNPSLVDQTNREGLRECPERQVLVKLLKHVLEEKLRRFLKEVDDQDRVKRNLDFSQIESRINQEGAEIRESIQLLRRKYPQIEADTKVVANIEQAIRQINDLMKEAKALADAFEQRRSQMVNLAGLGLMVEVIAHELNRATLHTLSTLANAQRGIVSIELKSTFATLEAQLKTLQKRLRVLDPLSTAGRQRKEKFELISWVKDVLDAHSVQFQRHEVECMLEVHPHRTSFEVYAVKGMVVQILENLISNSVYWLKQQRKAQPGFRPNIVVSINPARKSIAFTDNGPGIEPGRREEIFQAFVTTKPPGEGKGLGLFISQEIARYNGARLYLSDAADIHPDTLNTFILELEARDRD